MTTCGLPISSLTAEDLREIDEAFATIDIKGAPLSRVLDATVDR